MYSPPAATAPSPSVRQDRDDGVALDTGCSTYLKVRLRSRLGARLVLAVLAPARFVLAETLEVEALGLLGDAEAGGLYGGGLGAGGVPQGVGVVQVGEPYLEAFEPGAE